MTPESILGYEPTERTRFRVFIEIHDGRDPLPAPFKPGKVVAEFLHSLTECQWAFVRLRELSGLGGSQFGDGLVYDEYGQNIARISYNGRIWSPHPWPTAAVVAEAPAPEVNPSPIAVRFPL